MSNLVGTWRITVPQSEGNPEAFQALHTFFADRNWIEINSAGDANHGVWAGEDGTYGLTFEGYTFDSERKHSGRLQVRAAIELGDDDHLRARWEQDMTNLQGTVTRRAYWGTFEGTRMRVESLQTAPAA